LKKIVWISSYPKSGNTWMRLLLANYYKPELSQSIGINDLSFAPLTSLRATIDEWSLIESSDLLAPEVEDHRRRGVAQWAMVANGRAFMKVHDAWALGGDGSSLFLPAVTEHVVYVIRNPMDVAVSLAHHFDISPDRAVEFLCDSRFTLSPQGRGIFVQLPQIIGNWSQHVSSWIHESGLPLTVVRYEDMVANTADALGCVVRALDGRVVDGRVSAAVDASLFERLQMQEQSSGFRERVSARSPFFRSGRVGEGRARLTTACRESLQMAHRDTMMRFGYLEHP